MADSKTSEQAVIASALTPARIMEVGMGFWASKVLLTAVKLQLFSLLSQGPLTGKDIKKTLALGCSVRHVYDWLDALVSMGFLERRGLLDEAEYTNAEDANIYLDKKKPFYMGGMLEMANNRLYQFWGDLEEGLLTGQPQNEGKGSPQGNMDFFTELYQDERKLKEFMDAMSGIQTGNFVALTSQFDFNKYNTMLDVGGADGWLSIQVCLRHSKIQCSTFDLPPVAPLARQKINNFHLAERIHVLSGDFMKDDFPSAEIITMGNILHGMDEEKKQMLVQKVYNALPEGGIFMAIENIIDNDRRQNTFGLLMSLNMLIENGDAFDYTLDDFERWTEQAGFTRAELLPLAGPASAAIAYK